MSRHRRRRLTPQRVELLNEGEAIRIYRARLRRARPRDGPLATAASTSPGSSQRFTTASSLHLHPRRRHRSRPRRRPPRQIAATRASSRVGEPRHTSSSICTSSSSSTTSSTTIERSAPARRRPPCQTLATRASSPIAEPRRASSSICTSSIRPSPPPAATERGSAGAEALPGRGRSDERSLRRRRAASPAVSRESDAAACAQQPPRQRRAAATSAQLITAIGGSHTPRHQAPGLRPRLRFGFRKLTYRPSRSTPARSCTNRTKWIIRWNSWSRSKTFKAQPVRV